MARQPDAFAGRPITGRSPYTIPGFMPAQETTQGYVTITHNADRDFEIHRILFRPVGTAPVEGSDPLWRWFVQITDVNHSQELLPAPTMIAALIKSADDASWELAEPFYMVRSAAMTIVVTPAPYASPASFPAMEVSFQGSLVYTAPATDWR